MKQIIESAKLKIWYNLKILLFSTYWYPQFYLTLILGYLGLMDDVTYHTINMSLLQQAREFCFEQIKNLGGTKC